MGNQTGSLIEAFKNNFQQLYKWLCSLGMWYPDDKHSGIQVGDKTYTVVYSWGGKKKYIKENGDICSVDKDFTDKGIEWEWVNINERHLQELDSCYRTPGGEVKIRSWWSINEDMHPLNERHYVINSSDLDNPVGRIYEKVPGDWVPMRCELANMENRDIVYIKRCYLTPGGKVEIEGFESRDPELLIRVPSYTILQSTDANEPQGKKFTVIPDTWTRMVCDFPDMTQRNILQIDDCYDTEAGKVRIEGIVSVDYILGYREEYYSVAESTDPNIDVGSVYRKIPDTWTKTVCDFADLTQRDTEIIERCYMTNNTGISDGKEYTEKVSVRSYITYGARGEIRDERHLILQSSFDELVFEDDTVSSTGSWLNSIPVAWKEIICDLPDLNDRHFVHDVRCYRDGNGIEYKIRNEVIYDSRGKIIKQNHIILRSSEAEDLYDQIDSLTGYMEVDCSLPDLTQRFWVPVKECYENEVGDKFYVEGFRIKNHKEDVAMRLVVQDTVGATVGVAAGDVLTAIPAGFLLVVCKCSCGYE